MVFGDIGTSPLYALRTMLGRAGSLDRTAVLGVTSLVVWTLLAVVTALYVGTLLRHDNDGEGGLLALVGLLRRSRRVRATAVVSLLGIAGAATFLGDSVVTPAISVLSAAEGLEIATPSASAWVLPVALTILAGVFWLQHKGSGTIGRFYGPVMLVWFAVLAVTGAASLFHTPQAAEAISPYPAAVFVAQRPLTAFLCLGAVILAVTGAEALYADLGHFGRRAISRCWLLIVLPALVLAYLGEAGAVLREGARAAAEPFYAVVPGIATVPVLVVACLATVIASEAVIAGAFTVLHQAGGLGFFPDLRTLHPSEDEAARIYLPAVNWTLAVAVLGIVLLFRSSDRLSAAYGVAVASTFVCTVTLLLLLARRRLLPALFLLLVAVFFAATLPKVVEGGWVPLGIGLALFTVMSTWWAGQRRLDRARADQETRLPDVVAHARDAWARRTPGATVFLTPDRRVSPLALRRLLDTGWSPSEQVVLLSWHVEDHPGASPAEPRVELDEHDDLPDGLVAVEVTLGYRERLDVRHVLQDARERQPQALGAVDPDEALYVVSLPIPRPVRTRGPASWWRRLFLVLDRLSTDRVERLELPRERTLVVGGEVPL